jgi:hypothetical protein
MQDTERAHPFASFRVPLRGPGMTACARTASISNCPHDPSLDGTPKKATRALAILILRIDNRDR